MASQQPHLSKAQTCFFNILRIISSIPPPPSHTPKPQPCPSPTRTRGISIDLNLSGESESFGENETNSSPNTAEEVGDKSVEISDTQVQSFNGTGYEEQSNSKGNGGDDVKTVSFAVKGHDGDNNCLDLLIEAAKLVFAADESNSEEVSRVGGLSPELRTRRNDALGEAVAGKRKGKWVVAGLCSEMDDASFPVVRSKRGRSQVLPYRFRDSVVEPLKRPGRPNRTSSNAVPRKRLVGSRPTT